MCAVMGKKENIRNVSVIGHFDHGKTTLADFLVSKAGIISEHRAGESRYLDTRRDEQERCMSMKYIAISLLVKLENQNSVTVTDSDRCENEENGFLINLIDTPGHTDFTAEVTCALRITDGVLVVIDCVAGICLQTEIVLRQALAERLKPILFINKMDRALLELKFEPEQLYQTFKHIVEHFNQLILSFGDYTTSMGNVTVDPCKGSVGFGCGLHGWVFTLKKYAEMYSKKFKIDVTKLTTYLWGENFFNWNAKKWEKQKEPENERAFCMYVLDPIYKVFDCVMNKKADIKQMLFKIGIDVKNIDMDKDEKSILKVIMHAWLPAEDALLQMIVVHLPSPAVAQEYRMGMLYVGSNDDINALAIKNCDPMGPLIMYISKMVPISDEGRFYAFGRVFSGKVTTGMKVHVMVPNNISGKNDVFYQTIEKTVLMMGRDIETIEEVPPGNICGLFGVDQYLLKTGTITTLKNAHNIKAMRFTVLPLIKVGVEPIEPCDLPNLIEGLKRLSKSDPVVQCITEESGKHIITGVGELHLEICLKDLEDHACVPIKKSNTFVSCCESVSAESTQICLSQSPNKHNSFYMKAYPMPDGLAEDIDNGVVGLHNEYLRQKYDFKEQEVSKIWSFGPHHTGPNILLDCTKELKYLDAVKEHVITGFQWGTREGVLADENLRGVRFNLFDGAIHCDNMRRHPGQIICAIRKCIIASYLTAAPRIMEPIYQCEIQCPKTIVDDISNILTKRRSKIFSQREIVGTPNYVIKAYLPINDSSEFAADVCYNTRGQAVSQCTFHHWKIFPGDPMKPSSKAYNIVQNIRKQKDLPDLNEYLHKLLSNLKIRL
ncbi:hypothetical protein FQA39_LY19050 [Lamprigera yunnana]|nr:hypothetical protein FQA39_LY19050 [Lamprigera yunnana]